MQDEQGLPVHGLIPRARAVEGVDQFALVHCSRCTEAIGRWKIDRTSLEIPRVEAEVWQNQKWGGVGCTKDRSSKFPGGVRAATEYVKTWVQGKHKCDSVSMRKRKNH